MFEIQYLLYIEKFEFELFSDEYCYIPSSRISSNQMCICLVPLRLTSCLFAPIIFFLHKQWHVNLSKVGFEFHVRHSIEYFPSSSPERKQWEVVLNLFNAENYHNAWNTSEKKEEPRRRKSERKKAEKKEKKELKIVEGGKKQLRMLPRIDKCVMNDFCRCLYRKTFLPNTAFQEKMKSQDH